MARLGAEQLMACELVLQNAMRCRPNESDNFSANCQLAARKGLRFRPEWGKTYQPWASPGETEQDTIEP